MFILTTRMNDAKSHLDNMMNAVTGVDVRETGTPPPVGDFDLKLLKNMEDITAFDSLKSIRMSTCSLKKELNVVL